MNVEHSDVRSCTQGVYSCFVKRLLRNNRQQHPQSSDSAIVPIYAEYNGRLRSSTRKKLYIKLCVWSIYHVWSIYIIYSIYLLERTGRICSSFPQFKDRHYRLTRKLMEQGFWYSALCAAFKKFTRLHKDNGSL